MTKSFIYIIYSLFVSFGICAIANLGYHTVSIHNAKVPPHASISTAFHPIISCLPFPLPGRSSSLPPLRPSNSLSISPPLGSFHTVKFLLQHRLERIVSSRKQHNVVCVYGFAAAVFGEDFEIASCVCYIESVSLVVEGMNWGESTDLSIHKFSQCANELRCCI